MALVPLFLERRREIEIAEIDSTLETNVKGLYLFTRGYLRALAGKSGIILNVSSSVSDTITPNLSSYASSKAAVNRSVIRSHYFPLLSGFRVKKKRKKRINILDLDSRSSFMPVRLLQGFVD